MKHRTTYANLTATAALVIAVAGGGTALAAGLAKNSVGSPQIKKSAVRTADLAPGAVRSAQVQDGTITGADVDEASLGTVPGAVQADRATRADRVDNLLVAAVKSADKAQPWARDVAEAFKTPEFKAVLDKHFAGYARPGFLQ